MGSFGAILGLITMAFVRNPKPIEPEVDEEVLHLQNPTDGKFTEKKTILQEFKGAIVDLV